MPKFCPECGKSLKPGAQFCPSCGGTIKTEAVVRRKPVSRPQQRVVRPIARPVAPPPPPKKGGGCALGCGLGCLITLIVTLLVIGGLIGFGYYYFFVRDKGGGNYFDIDAEDEAKKPEECGSSLNCLENNLKICDPAKGETEIEDAIEIELSVVGSSGKSCVVYIEITNVDTDELPEQLEFLEKIPSFIRGFILKSLHGECLVPQNVYTLGMEETMEYLGENMLDVCRGNLLDFFAKYSEQD